MKNNITAETKKEQENQFRRTELMFGSAAMEKLKNARVAVFGVGGVGGYVVEALARSGVGRIDLIDNDDVSVTNINRQIIALHSTVGRAKVDVARDRISDINPKCVVNCHKVFYTPETEDMFDFSDYDYVVDAIDTVSGKISIVLNADKTGVPVISSMGAGNKIDPTAFEVADIYRTSVCPLARVMRYELKKRGIKSLKVVYSTEKPVKRTDSGAENDDENKGETVIGRGVPASNAFVPSVVGLIIAGEVIKDLVGISGENK